MMKKIRKFIRYIIVGALFIGLTVACSDMLDQEPQGQWVDGDQDNVSGSFESDVFTLYSKLRGYHITAGTTALAIHCFRSEDAEKGSTASDGARFGRMYDNFEYVTTDPLIKNYWSANYAIIHLANKVIYNIDEEKQKKELTEADLVNYSEAHFFRAFAFFNLVRAFGDVPLVNFKIENAEEANIAKSEASKIYKQIDSDLSIAEKHLPKTWSSVYVGRLTWGAARALHAKTYMMRNDWQNLYKTSKDVINSGLYNLNTPYNKIFTKEGENTGGSIFELQCTSTDAFPASNEVGSQFAQVQGVRGAGKWNLGWGWHTPTELLAKAFEDGDPRKDDTLLYFIRTGEDPATIPENKPWGEKPVANKNVTNAYYNKKAYTSPSLREKYSKSGFWTNIRLIRYSDVLLMAAESANELGNSGEALLFLEQVRSRARGNTNALPQITTTDQMQLRDAIRHERRVELGMEFDRFYDLVRWGIAEKVLHAAGKTNYQPKHALLPIPQNEIDKSNGVLIQNPNY